MTHRGYRGGLLTLIHNKHAFPGNLSKIPTPANISPFLQIIRIANQPLQPWLVINIYMPLHEEDLPFIPIIQITVTEQINAHPNHTYVICGNFNRDIALRGRQNDQQISPPQDKDYQWRSFMDNLDLTYLTTNTTFPRKGGNNYTHNSLIDGFFIKTPNNNQYTSTINQNMELNSDHMPVQLHIPPNTLIAETPSSRSEPLPRTLNPIPKENLKKFHTQFSEANSNQIDDLTQLPKNYVNLTIKQWQMACTSLETIITNISNIVIKTCSTTPVPILPDKIAKQGGYLPKKLQKQWKNTSPLIILLGKQYTSRKKPQLEKPPHHPRNC
jgi:hypothetical protein